MNLGLKWTAEEYTNPQGIITHTDESLLDSDDESLINSRTSCIS